MAERPKGYGMTAELQAKNEAKFDSDQADEVFQWIEEILGEPLGGRGSIEEVTDSLKDGVQLCKLANVVADEEHIKYNTSKMAFKQMENISKFLDFCQSIGCSKMDLFQTVDLYEGVNIPQVLSGLAAFGRKVQVIRPDLPVYGPKEADKNVREFTEEQIQAGKGVIGLQMGSNTGASQSGMSFGTQRQIH